MIEPIHPSIVKAICAVQASISSVAKTQFNVQGKYKFASADDIYAAVARKFGEVGLIIYPLQMSEPEIKRVEKTQKNRDTGENEVVISQWGQFSFGYMLATEEATWFDPRSARTIFIQIIGPQTFNAAESYCQKQFLRSLLKLPTGDVDLDSMPQADNEDDQIELANGQRVKRKSSAEGKRDGSVKRFNELRSRINGATEATTLMFLRSAEAETWNTMPRAWAETLSEDYYVKMREFGVEVDPETGQVIPDAAE